MKIIFLVFALAIPAQAIELRNLYGIYDIKSVDSTGYLRGELLIKRGNFYEFRYKEKTVMKHEVHNCRKGRFQFDGKTFSGQSICSNVRSRNIPTAHTIFFNSISLHELQIGTRLDFYTRPLSSPKQGKVIRPKFMKVSP